MPLWEQVCSSLKTLIFEYCKLHPNFDPADAYFKLRQACDRSGEDTPTMMVKLWSHPGITELGQREICSILGEVIREDDARTPVSERPSKLFQNAVLLVCMLQARAMVVREPGHHERTVRLRHPTLID